MNAIDLLLADHSNVRKLLEQLDKTTDRGVKSRMELFGRIKTELTLHEIIEEDVLYPALDEHPKAKDLVLEGREAHEAVDRLMGELSNLAFDDETWGPKAMVMKEHIEHHITEEESAMFEKARSIFDRSELDDLGEEMVKRKDEVLRAEAAGVWSPARVA